jgi:[acyl-carrier-protein] S-malonyltransferase
MGVELRSASPRAQELFGLADQITGLPITRLSTSGPLDELTATEIAQPAVVVHSLAALAYLREHARLEITAVAGHSVGELAACVAAGALDDESALHLVHARAPAMAFACAQVDGTMAAVLGLDEDALRQACDEASTADEAVELANLNAPGQLVISGNRAAIERASGLAKAAGARRVLPLNVGGPFHSVYMRPAADQYEKALRLAPFSTATVPLIGNVDGKPITATEDISKELHDHLYSSVRWTDTLRQMADMGCDRFLEIGPGQVQAGLVKRTLPDVRVVSFGAPAQLEAVLALLG